MYKTIRDRDGTVKSMSASLKPKGWSVKKMKPGSTLKFEDGSSVTKTKQGKVIKRRVNH